VRARVDEGLPARRQRLERAVAVAAVAVRVAAAAALSRLGVVEPRRDVRGRLVAERDRREDRAVGRAAVVRRAAAAFFAAARLAAGGDRDARDLGRACGGEARLFTACPL
jgi:hypothetical protein